MFNFKAFDLYYGHCIKLADDRSKMDVRNDQPLRKNYDYGEGLYMNMDQYKSVSDFLRKKRRKRVIKWLCVAKSI